MYIITLEWWPLATHTVNSSQVKYIFSILFLKISWMKYESKRKVDKRVIL